MVTRQKKHIVTIEMSMDFTFHINGIREIILLHWFKLRKGRDNSFD